MSLLYEAWRRARREEARLDAVLGAEPPGARRSMGGMLWAGWLLAVVLAGTVGALAGYVWWSRQASPPSESGIQSGSARVPLRASISSAKALGPAFRGAGALQPGKTVAKGARPVATTGVAPRMTLKNRVLVASGGPLRSPGPAIPLASAPASIRASFPAIKIAVHAWNPDLSQRLVMIGGQTYRIGDEIAPGVSLVGITRTGEIVSYRGYRLILPGE